MRSSGSVWRGKRVLITAGPTREYMDPVRFLTNASSGRMGIELARAALRRGASVCLVLGPTAEKPPRGVELVNVVSALEMHRQALKRSASCDVVIASAAVGDWRFTRRARHKIKRMSGPTRLTLLPNPDIIHDVARRKAASGSRQILVGFALETQRQEANACAKLKKKGLDLIIVNGPEALNARSSRVAIGSGSGVFLRLKHQDKRGVAGAILRSVAEFWKAR